MNPFAPPSHARGRPCRRHQSGELARLAKAKPQPKPRRQPKAIGGIDGFVISLTALPRPALRVICPFPPPELNPNARGHWSRRSKAARAYRRECWALTLEALGRAPGDGEARFIAAPSPFAAGPIRLHLDFFPPDRRQRDDDNAIASFKAGRDGIAAALKVNDRRFVTSHTWHHEPRACVVATLFAEEIAE